jgi:hypothetical protein
MATIIDGKKTSTEIKDELREQVAKLNKINSDVTLCVIQVGADPASTIYVNNKKKACEYIGIKSLSYELPEETTQDQLVELINELCNNHPYFLNCNIITNSDAHSLWAIHEAVNFLEVKEKSEEAVLNALVN